MFVFLLTHLHSFLACVQPTEAAVLISQALLLLLKHLRILKTQSRRKLPGGTRQSALRAARS